MEQVTETYTLIERDLFLTDGSREYKISQIKDWADEDKPRERLVANGPAGLTLSDLLAVVLQVGTKKEGVIEMASRVLTEYGEKGVISETDPKRLMKDLNIPLAKACQLVACFELGRRLFSGNTHGEPIVLRTPEQVYAYTRELADLPKEHLRGLYLNSHNQLVHDEVISIGTLTSNVIHPREVFQPALVHSAAAVILVHNHPSGSMTPSSADITVTNQLIEAGRIMGIDLLDHVIVTKTGYTSVPANYSQYDSRIWRISPPTAGSQVLTVC